LNCCTLIPNPSNVGRCIFFFLSIKIIIFFLNEGGNKRSQRETTKKSSKNYSRCKSSGQVPVRSLGIVVHIENPSEKKKKKKVLSLGLHEASKNFVKPSIRRRSLFPACGKSPCRRVLRGGLVDQREGGTVSTLRPRGSLPSLVLVSSRLSP